MPCHLDKANPIGNGLILQLLLQVGQLREVSNKVHNAELKLFLEVELSAVSWNVVIVLGPAKKHE